MLQSLVKTQSFPLGRALRGYIGRNNDDEAVLNEECDLEELGFAECKRVFGEKNHIVDNFNEDEIAKYKKWLLCMWRKRLVWSVFLLNVLPMIYFWFVLSILTDPYWMSFTMTNNISELVNIGAIFWSALGVFGFYRFHHALIVGRWKSLFYDVAKQIEKRGTSFDWFANIVWGCLYLLPSLHLLIFLPFF
jgi:hypothetical protein